jgi:hypothetical protein
MKTIEQNILDVTEGYILHQVNAMGKMNSGVAKAIRDKYPKVFSEYEKECYAANQDKGLWSLMGYAQLVEVTNKLCVVNLFGQYDYRKNEFDIQRYTEYGSFHNAIKEFDNLTNFIRKTEHRQVYLPYKIGSDRGGADFDIIQQIVQEYIPDAIFCKLPS